MMVQTEPSAKRWSSVRHGAPMRGAWTFYFVLKLLLLWRGILDFHPALNLLLFSFLVVPVSARVNLVRNIIAVPLAAALLYYDTFLPSISRLFASAGELANFSLPYLAELVQRFISVPILITAFLVLFFTALARRIIRVNAIVFVILCGLTIAGLKISWKPTADPASAAQSVAWRPSQPGGERNDATLNKLLQDFYGSEARRMVQFPAPAATDVPFDLLFIHVCSLSWDDVAAVGMQEHPLWKSFDILFRRFNSVATYSGPAAVRLNRAPCGQTSESKLYAPTAEQCYLMPSLRRAGFDINLAMNHDGHFDDFLQLVRQQGVVAEPLPLTGLPVSMKGFDGSLIHDDEAVLARWQTVRKISTEPRTALYYNTISLHDGNRLNTLDGASLTTRESYRFRLGKMLDEMERLMQSLSTGNRRTVVVFIPEHGAAVRGDRLQIPGLREIPTPAITLVPVGIKIIDPAVTAEQDTAYVDTQTSFLSLSHVLSTMLKKSPFSGKTFDPAPYLLGLPTTEFVAESQQVVMRVDKDYFWRESTDHWRPFSTELPK